MTGLPLVVGIGHKARSGKDTAADTLVNVYSYTKVCLADPVRDLAYELFPNTRKAVDQFGWEQAKSQPHVRETLQNIGTACKHVFGDDFWSQQTKNKIIEIVDQGGRAVVPDVRFPVEAKMIRSLQGFLMKIHRPDRPHISREHHVSETALNDFTDWDYILHNNRDVHYLQETVIEAVSVGGLTMSEVLFDD